MTKPALDRPKRTSPAGRRKAKAASPERTAVVSHEIRGPLGVMTALAEVLLSRDLAPEERRLVELIRLAGAHVVGVTEDLLAEASFGADRFRISPSSFSPAELARAVVDLWQPLMQGGDRVLTAVVAPGAPELVVSDEARIRQILFNLVSNAARATPTGTIEVAVEPAADPDRVAFVVRDTGSGLPDGFQPAPFASGAAATAGAAGTGLGLWISGRIAEALSGSLSLESRDGGGVLARLEIPVTGTPDQVAEPVAPKRRRRSTAASTAPAAAKASKPRRRASGTAATGRAPARRSTSVEPRLPKVPPSPLGGSRALVIDDSPVSLMLMETILTSFDVEAASAASGAEAVDMASLSPPDVILLDWSLRGETGADVLDRLRDILGSALPPVVAVTASTRRPLAPGLSGHVAKPFTPRELYEALTSALAVGEALETTG